MIRSLGFLLPVALASSFLGACSGSPSSQGNPPGTTVASTKQRDTTPSATTAQVAAVAQSERDFGLALYGKLAQPGKNLFLSPHSIDVALSMLYAGAANGTASDMKSALQIPLPDDQYASAMDALDLALSSRGQGLSGINGQPFTLRTVDALWGEQGFQFEAPFLDTLAVDYGAAVHVLDFADAAASVSAIDSWVSKETNGKIPMLLGPGAVNADTRLVLTNAVYFNASWATPFEPSATSDQPFTRADGSTVSVATMSGSVEAAAYVDSSVTAVALPYAGDQLTMLIIQPSDLTTFEAGLDGAAFDGVVSQLKGAQVTVTLPKWQLDIKSDLVQPLSALGMGSAFGSSADFSGIDGAKDLSVSDVLHEAYVSVDEAGTEAAAATAVVVGTSVAVQPIKVTIDHPFIFAIRDNATGAVVFLGRVVDPSAS